MCMVCMTNNSHGTNTWDERETEGTGASATVQGFVGEGSRRRLPVPLLTARAPWDLELSPGRHPVMAELFSHLTLGLRRKPIVEDAKC